MSAEFYIGGYVFVLLALLIALFWFDDGKDEFSLSIGVVACVLWPVMAPCIAVFFGLLGLNIAVKSIRDKRQEG